MLPQVPTLCRQVEDSNRWLTNGDIELTSDGQIIEKIKVTGSRVKVRGGRWHTIMCNEDQYLVFYSSCSVVCLAIVVVLLFSDHIRRGPTNLNLPPGPKPWPIIGNLNLMGALPHRSMHELSKKYGEIMHLKFGSRNVVTASSVEMAKIFLKTMGSNFACRPKNAAGKYTTYNYSDITWSPYGPYWRQGRKMFVMELFSAKRLESYQYIRVEETKSFLRKVYKSCGKEIRVKDLLSTLNMNVIGRMVLGKTYWDDELGEVGKNVVSGDEFHKMVNEWFLLNGVLNIGDWIPWIGFLDLQGYVKRMKTVSKKFDRFLEHVLKEHDERRTVEGENFVQRDMVDVLLQLADDPSLDVKLERHGVKAFTQDLLAGGTESSTITVEWAIAQLLKKPEIFKKATNELDRVIGRDRWVEETDMVNLPYINAIVKETMRLHPVAPMLPPRRTREDCKVAGYDIPKDTLVLVSVWTIGRDSELWDNPEDFCPERFIGKEIDIKGNDFELLPFGAGRRMCPGYSLGIKVIESSLANLIHGFNWKLPGNMNEKDLEMEEIYGLSTPKKIPLVTIAQPRLQFEMYG
ncbi:trimethyltridecatetraene synthase-like [Rutidosis leptorrhynchoides]|uniref:trimethyltridecatetraene synthase-like n=1 Tax=Rutidosis leptorrhynchoides TaxID=125765 RepID=UPI003A9A0A83